MGQKVRLNHKEPSRMQKELEAWFREYVVGQDRAIRHLVRRIMYANSMEGVLRDPTKPAGTFVYLGPTGVGKTRLVEVFANLLFGSFDAMVKIDCSEIMHQHEISRLVGSPPGYIRSDEEPWLSQRRIDEWGYLRQIQNGETRDQLETLNKQIHKLDEEIRTSLERNGLTGDEKKKIPPEIKSKIATLNQMVKISSMLMKQNDYQPGAYPSILLFDEMEKAHPSLFQLLLQIHDKARLTLHGVSRDEHGNRIPSEQVSFHNTFIFYTSNINQDVIRKMLSNRGMGFSPDVIPEEGMDHKIYKTSLGQLEKMFSPEFLGRIGKENILVFSPLSESQIREGLERIIIPDFIKRFTVSFPLILNITENVKEFLVQESYDTHNKIFGMRALKGVFAKRIEDPLILLTTKSLEEGGIMLGDEILIDIKDGELAFYFYADKRTPLDGALKRMTKPVMVMNDGKIIATFKLRKP